MIKMLDKLSINRTYLNIIKAISEKTRANIVLKNEFLKFFFFKTGTRIWFPLSLLLFNIVLEVPARAIKQDTNKKHPNKKELKLPMFGGKII